MAADFLSTSTSNIKSVIRHPSRLIFGAALLTIILVTVLVLSRPFTNISQEAEVVRVQYQRPGWIKQQEASFKKSSGNKSDAQSHLFGPSSSLNFSDGRTRFSTFREALEARSDPQRIIIMALIDMGALTMGLNFWETSLLPNDIQTYLFISSSTEACQHLHRRSIPCFVYMEDEAGASKSVYQSTEFLRKMNIRSYMILSALQLGYTVLHTDVDVVWFKNPFQYIPCRQCDVAALWDCGAWNAGFIFVRPTPGAMYVYQKMVTIANETTKDDQKALNFALQSAKRNNSFQLVKLPPKRFHCGYEYFEKGKRDFADMKPCIHCVVVHNNWIVSMEAKMYRFRELHHWLYDDDGYYGDPKRKYIVYNNTAIGRSISETKDLEKSSLRSALAIGQILNRTVILPAFHITQNRQGSLLHFLKVRDFDSQFSGNYREHTFLSNKKVPQDVVNDRTRVFCIDTHLSHTVNQTLKAADHCLYPRNPQGATDKDIKEWFGDIPQSVLVFHSLYDAFSNYADSQMQEEFEEKLKLGLRPAKYRQF